MKTKYHKTFHFPFSPGVFSDDKVAKDCSNLIGKRIVITEKLDGENCGHNNLGVYARSHTEFTISPWATEVRQINQRIRYDLIEGMFVFGENMEGIHSIEYTNLKSYFYTFGIREGDTWYSWKDVEEISFLLELPTVPVLFDGICETFEELKYKVESLVKGRSTLDGEMEGVVARVYDSFKDEDFEKSVIKWVRKNHVTTSSHWNKSWKKAKLNL